jgi:amino acid permease
MSKKDGPLVIAVIVFLVLFFVVVAYSILTGSEKAEEIRGYAPQILIVLIFVAFVVAGLIAVLSKK